MGMKANPGEHKTIFVVQGIPPEEIIKNVTGWLHSAQPSIRRVLVHNLTKSSEVQISFATNHELHVTITDTEFKFFNEVPHEQKEEPVTGKPKESKTEPKPEV